MTTHVMTDSPAAEQNRPHLPTGPNEILHAHILGRAIRHLQTRYAAVEQDLVRSTVLAAYRELNRTARLKTYLPTLAIREAEQRLRRLDAAAGGPLGDQGTTDTAGHTAVITAIPIAA